MNIQYSVHSIDDTNNDDDDDEDEDDDNDDNDHDNDDDEDDDDVFRLRQMVFGRENCRRQICHQPPV